MILSLFKDELPVGITLDLYPFHYSARVPAPHPYDPREDTPLTVTPALPMVAEVRISLYRDETLAWALPLCFAIDRLLTAGEVITKIVEAIWLLQAWEKVHADEAWDQLYNTQTERAGALQRNYLIN